MKYIILIYLFTFSIFICKAQTYSNLAEVFSSGGGESTGGNYSNFGVTGETFVDYPVTGGNYITSIGFLYYAYSIPVIINENFNEQIIRIFPNPSDGIINIENKNLKADKIEIFNIFGEKLYERIVETSQGMFLLDISELSEGMYFLKILDNDGEILKTEKIIKE